MSRILDTKIEDLTQDLVKMNDLVTNALDKAVKSFIEQDSILAEKVEGLDTQLYEIYVEIERKSFELIARYQPLAGDLRTIGTYLSITTDLYRIGRYAYDIALLTKKMKGIPHIKKLVSIPRMARITQEMLADSLRAFVNRDIDLAKSLSEKDDEVDAIYEEIFRELLTYIMERSSAITPSMYYLLVARYLERVSDHACYMGERIVYMVTGERLRIR